MYGFGFHLNAMCGSAHVCIVHWTCLVDCKYVILYSMPLTSVSTFFPLESCNKTLNVNSPSKAIANVILHNTNNNHHKRVYLSYRSMSGDVRHFIKETCMDGFEEIKWSWPKRQAYLMYCYSMRNRLIVIITTYKGTHEFTYLSM